MTLFGNNDGDQATAVEDAPESEAMEEVIFAEERGTVISADPEERTVILDLSEIYIDPKENIRKVEVSQDKIEKLAADIHGHGGLLENIGVIMQEPAPQTMNKSYALAYGFCRCAALEFLAERFPDQNWGSQLTCTLLNVTSLSEYRLIQISENENRNDLTPIDKAMAIRDVLEDDDSLTQAELASRTGLSAPGISQLLKLLDLPETVQAMINEGELSFSHARLLNSVPVDRRAAAAKVGKGRVYDSFKKYIESNFDNQSDDNQSDDDASNGDASSIGQRSHRLLSQAQLQSAYLPFAVSNAKAADKEEKKYTAYDVWLTVVDALKTVMRDPATKLSKSIEPYLQKLAKEEEDKKARSESDKVRDLFFKEKVKLVNSLMDMPPNENGTRAFPDVTSAIAPVADKVSKLDESVIASLGFELNVKKFPEELLAAWTEDRAARNKRKAEKDARAKKKKEEEAAKKAAAEAGATPDPAPVAAK